MRLRFLRNLITYVILLFYILVPLLDRMVCADCIAPFPGEATISHLQTPHDDVPYEMHDGAFSKTSGDKAAASFCLICANVLMGVQVCSPHAHITVVEWDGPCAMPALSELHYSIHKPPQNLFA